MNKKLNYNKNNSIQLTSIQLIHLAFKLGLEEISWIHVTFIIKNPKIVTNP